MTVPAVDRSRESVNFKRVVSKIAVSELVLKIESIESAESNQSNQTNRIESNGMRALCKKQRINRIKPNQIESTWSTSGPLKKKRV